MTNRIGSICPSRPVRRAGAIVVWMAFAPVSLAAQSSARVTFETGSTTQDGYSGASAMVTYRLLECAGDIHILYSADRDVDARTPYWYQGKHYELPTRIKAPRREGIPFKGVVVSTPTGNVIGRFNDGLAVGFAGAGCYGQTQVVAPMSSIVGREATSEERSAALSALHVRVEGAPGTVRNSAAEAYIESENARERQVEADRTRAEADRVAKGKADARAREERLANQKPSAQGAESASRDSARGNSPNASIPSRSGEGSSSAEPASESTTAASTRKTDHADTAKTPVVTDAEALAAFQQSQAASFEERGDRAYALGVMGYQDALSAWRQAQRIYPSERVAAKIANLEGMMAGVEALQAIGSAVGNTLSEAGTVLSAAGFPDYVGMYIGYNGLTSASSATGSATTGGSASRRARQDGMFGMEVMKLIALEGRIGYTQGPQFEHRIVFQNGTPLPRTSVIRYSESGVNYGLSGGLSLPLKSLITYAMYGIEGMVAPKAELISNDVTLGADPKASVTSSVITYGVNWRLAKSGTGFGVAFNQYSTPSSLTKSQS